MKRLKITLQYKNMFPLLALFSIIFSLTITLLPNYKSKFKNNETNFKCIIEEYKIDGDKLDLSLNCKEKLIGTYYIKTESEKANLEQTLKIGKTLTITGSLSHPNNNTVPNLFNYKNYLKGKKIYYILNIENLKLENKKVSFFNNLKNKIKTKIDKINHNEYLHAYILGNTEYLKKSTLESYRQNGISHLFALSGLHVSIFSLIIITLLKKFKIKEIFIQSIVFLFLIIFSYISGFSPSILRASLLSFLISINKIYKLNIETKNIFYLILSLFLITSPFIIYNTSFILSFITTYFIINASYFISSKNYIKGLFKVSLIAFISNIGISIYLFGYTNPLSIIYNLIFVPLVSFIIFPLTLITFIFPVFNTVLNLFTNMMENMSLFLSNINSLIYFPKINILELLIYYIILFTLIKTKNKKHIFSLLLILIFFKTKPLLITNTQLYFIDVGQGDCILIVTPHTNKTILIDTGGKITYKKEKWKERKNEYNLTKDSLIPFMRSIGIQKLDYIFLTHGDFDHAGEITNIINNFRVDKIYINKGEINKLENKIKDKQIIDFKTLKIDNILITSLNDTIFDNENDNSIVLHLKIENTNILLMADASIKTETEILKKYNLKTIDILKVGHHGSITSSSNFFIDEIKPKYSIISVGKNNRYNHPDTKVLKRLKNSLTFRTDENGTILFKIYKNKLKLYTYSP